MKKIVLFILGISFYATGFSQTAFTAGNLAVYRVGTGSAALAGSTTATFIDEYTTGGTLVQSIALPTTGTDKLTTLGTSTTEGFLSRSGDLSVLTFGGYDAVTGIATTGVARVVAVLKADGTLNLSTKLTDYVPAGNPRTTTSFDGSAFWVAGNSGGVRYATLGAATSTQINTVNPVNIRQVNIYNGNLYASTGSITTGVYQIGSGLPITGGQTTTNIIPSTGGSATPSGFAINTAGTVAYVADDRATGSGGGILKYTNSGAGWVFAYAFPTSTTTTIGARGLVVDFSGANPVIYGTSADPLPRIFTITDIGIAALPVTILTSPANTAFRGIAFAPQVTVVPLRFISFTGTNINNGFDLKWVTANEQNIAAFTVQKSVNGSIFEDISSMPARNNNLSSTYQHNYRGTDKGIVYFRIKATELSGKAFYTDIIKTNIKSGASFKIYPTVSTGNITLEYDASNSEGSISIVNMTGAEVFRKNVKADTGMETISIQQLSAGTYFIKYNTFKGQMQTQRFVKQ